MSGQKKRAKKSPSRTPGHYDPGMFEGVTSVAQFAKVLGVPEESIALIVHEDFECKDEDCTFKAVKGNRNFCCAHGRTWYPIPPHRGSAMHGPDFLRATSGKFRCCDCEMDSCKIAGYFPNQDAMTVPVEMQKFLLDHNNPKLFGEDKIEDFKNDNKKKMFLYAWHFFPQHREKDKNGKWIFNLHNNKDGSEKGKGGGVKNKYYDLERHHIYEFPPPRNTPLSFINNEYYAEYVRPRDRWIHREGKDPMPTWMIDMLEKDRELSLISSSASSSTSSNIESMTVLRRERDMYKARAMQLHNEKEKLDEKYEQKEIELAKEHSKQLSDAKKQYETRLSGMKRKYDEMCSEKDAEIKEHKERIAELKQANEKLEKELEETRAILEECRKRKGQPLRYDDLYEGGILSKNVRAYTFFNTVKINDLFLEILNYADGTEGSYPEGDGLCENLRPYSTVTREERSGAVGPPSLDPESPEYKKKIKNIKRVRKTTGRTWKDDYLAYCMYVRCGTTQEFVCGLFGISAGTMSDIFHEWTQVLDDSLQRWFPRPTRSQMLQAYPSRFIEADGHARCYMLLDAFECFSQTSSNPNVASSLNSDYKKHSTIKTLGACDPIGCPWYETVPDGFPGRASDVVATRQTGILGQVPFGGTAKVDKGFIVDNIGAAEGVIVDRPQKRKKHQTQQSTVDTSQTQKIGNTRIIVENVNGELKKQIRYLNVLIPCLQFGVISKIIRIGYLLQNFKKAIIQNNNPEDDKGPRKRPCRAEIRWYGKTDAGLRDVRGNVRLWGLKSEIMLHAELSAMEENKNKSAVEISEMVLRRNLDEDCREELYAKHNRPYPRTGQRFV